MSRSLSDLLVVAQVLKGVGIGIAMGWVVFVVIVGIVLVLVLVYSLVGPFVVLLVDVRRFIAVRRGTR